MVVVIENIIVMAGRAAKKGFPALSIPREPRASARPSRVPKKVLMECPDCAIDLYVTTDCVECGWRECVRSYE